MVKSFFLLLRKFGYTDEKYKKKSCTHGEVRNGFRMFNCSLVEFKLVYGEHTHITESKLVCYTDIVVYLTFAM